MLYHVGKEMEGGIKNSQILSLENLHNSFELPTSSQDDFLEQILSSLPNSPWPDLSNPSSNPNPNPNPKAAYPSLQDHLIQQQLLLSRGGGGSGLMPDLPLSLDAGADGSPFKSSPQGAQALFNAFSGALHGNAQATVPHQPFQAGAMSQPPAGTSTGGSGGQAPQRQRVRARRGQATDPHSIAERLRRERIAERMKALQELVPNGNKTDKASMLDEIIDYVKFLQLQVKVLSMSRLGGAAATPRVADLSSEGNQVMGTSTNGMSVTEHQVVKLMEEDMGSAMQYLQGKGLCLMPISLATAISTATCQPRNSNNPHQQHQSNGGVAGGQGPSSPNLSALTVQPANLVNGDGSVKDSNNPASKA